MTTQEAIDILTKFNAWRRGDIRDYPYKPKEIGHAIDRGIHALEVALRNDPWAKANRGSDKTECEQPNFKKSSRIMKNYVSAQTAWKLKNAGFPQPKVKVGQVWYNDLEAPSIIVKNIGNEFNTGEHHYIGCSLHDGRLGNDFPGSMIEKRCAFAPTAADVLELLPAYVLIKPGGKFLVYRTKILGQNSNDHDICSDESSAEACAKKFLNINGVVTP